VKTIIFINRVLQGNSLGVKDIGGFSEPKSQVKGIGYLDFTFFRTKAAGNAFFQVNVAGPPLYLYLKPPRFSS
jgi:hypothetical protein